MIDVLKYLGSKRELLPYINHMVKRTGARTVVDAFSGTTVVAQALAYAGLEVICNDMSEWSKTLGTCYLLNKKSKQEYHKLIEHLNGLTPKRGWFTEVYGGNEATSLSGLKRPWRVPNAMKLDAIREEIDRLQLDEVTKAVALVSLMLALDKVDATLGHYASYLRKWPKRTFNDMWLTVPEVAVFDQVHQVCQKDVFELLEEVQADLIYLDPPYGSSNDRMPASRVRYAAYYHIWKTVCLNDHPVVYGAANRRVDSSDRVATSVFEDFRRRNGRLVAAEAVERAVQMARCRWLLFSYSTAGRVAPEELNAIFRRHGEIVDVMVMDKKKNAMAGMFWTAAWKQEKDNYELLYLVRKNG